MVAKTQPVLVIAGSSEPAWTKVIASQLAPDWSIIRYTTHTGYVTRLADDHVALLLVDAADTHWRFWTTSPKTSPATRRIPIFLIGDSAELSESGLIAGADLVLSQSEMLSQLSQLVEEFARRSSPEAIEQMDCDCQQELPELAKQGVIKFNQQEFYAQHDLFEELWMATEGPVRDLYRAILQVGIAYYQILRGNQRGAKKMLLRSVQWLAILPDQCQGIDVAQLKADASRVREELERLEKDSSQDGLADFDRSLLKPIKMINQYNELL